MTFGRAVRIAILLVVLAMVALDTWLTRIRTTSWEKPLRATVYPIVADGRPATRDYVAGLAPENFAGVAAFLQREARRYGVALAEPLRLRLGPALAELPPAPPASRSVPGTIAWSLRLRWWASRRESGQPPPPSQVRLFVLYYDPAATQRVAHSLGLQKGLIGVVHAFASRSMALTNNVIIAHELLHTLGATDKYDPATGLPLFPEGFANPEQRPPYPQDRAELMGGRIPRAADRADIPETLAEVVVGPATAAEIGWVRP